MSLLGLDTNEEQNVCNMPTSHKNKCDGNVTRNVDKLRQYVITKSSRPASRINHVEHVVCGRRYVTSKGSLQSSTFRFV